MKIAIVTDSHLSARAPECVANWHAAAAAVARIGVDMTIHLGDISFDGQHRPDELAFAADLVAAWPTPMRCIPGNHDVGDGSGEAPWRPELLADYRRLFGPDRWLFCDGDWQLIGLNAQLFDSGSPEEAAQWDWLEEHARWAGSAARTILMLHRPIARPDPAEAARQGRYVPAGACERLLDGPLRESLRMVLSGHTHQCLDRCERSVRHVWVPSCAFILPDEMQTRVGEKTVGIGVLELDGTSARFDLLWPDGLRRHDVSQLPLYHEVHPAPS